MLEQRLFRAESMEVTDNGRKLTGYAVPFGIEAEVEDYSFPVPYLERFERGAFKNVCRSPFRVKLCYLHNDEADNWVGSGRLFREDNGGLWTEWKLDDPRKHPTAGIIAYKVADGQLPSLSVSFVPGRTRDTMRGGRMVRIRETVKQLDHVALVPEGAYPMLEPVAVRSKPRASSADRWREWRKGLDTP